MKHPVTSHVRKARNGDCEPKDEVLSLATRRKTIQHRRILSLYRRLIEAQSRSLSLSLSLSLMSDVYYQGLIQEWNCTLKSTACGKLFAFWIGRIL